jgi:hypothetical protein
MGQKDRRKNTDGLKWKRKNELKTGKDFWTAEN